MRMPLQGKTAVITGAGSGIGQALAIEASRRGMVVALVGRRAERLEETRARLVSAAHCLLIPADVTSPEARRAVRDRVARDWGLVHVLVNNAGIVSAGPLSELPDADLDRLIATNVSAPIALIREMLPLLRTASRARVVNMGSLVGDIALPLFTAYSASKFALRGLSDGLRRELKSLGIGVTYVAPRGARTAATEAVSRFTEPFGMSFDSPNSIARRVWDAVARGRDRVYPQGRERLFVLLNHLLPAIIDRALMRQLNASSAGRLLEASAPSSTPRSSDAVAADGVRG
jgi:short-subunit dehydrogenase